MSELEASLDLHRLVWNPDDFDGDTLLPSGFARSEILDPEKYLSVSRMDLFCPSAVIATAEGQSARADRTEGKVSREHSMSTFLTVEDVYQLATEVGEHPFSVSYEPLSVAQGDEIDDLGHSGIRNKPLQGSNKAAAQALQALLANEAGKRVCALEETLSRYQSAANK